VHRETALVIERAHLRPFLGERLLGESRHDAVIAAIDERKIREDFIDRLEGRSGC
jgi:hypothetical protein